MKVAIMVRHGGVALAKAGAAAMAAATRGRKTSFKSRREVMDHRLSHADAEVEEGLEEYRAGREDDGEAR